jgi:hypothetical protein
LRVPTVFDFVIFNLKLKDDYRLYKFFEATNNKLDEFLEEPIIKADENKIQKILFYKMELLQNNKRVNIVSNKIIYETEKIEI